MKLRINGEERSFANHAISAPFTLAALVETLGMKSDRVAVELNRNIVTRDRWSDTALQEGDRLEIVHFVGGGSTCDPAPMHLRKQDLSSIALQPDALI